MGAERRLIRLAEQPVFVCRAIRLFIIKGAAEIFTQYVAKEFGHRGIRSNIVAPCAIETDFNNAAVRHNPRMKSYVVSQTAFGHIGMADDIGTVICFSMLG